MHKHTRLVVLLSAPVLLSFVALAGCEQKKNESAPSPPITAAPSAPSSGALPGSSEKTEAPLPKASAGAEEAPNGLAGTWEGTYEAKKGSVEMPPKVADKVRTSDDGKVATGKGTITLTVSADGELKGKTEGALGAATLSGKAEGKAMTGQFFPDDALGKLAMFGILQATLEGDHVGGRIRVSSGDAAIIREAIITLKKK